MKKYIIIGLGNFGFTLACELFKSGHEVIAIDNNEALINKIKEHVTHAIITDAKDVDNLKDFIDKNTETVILNLGESLEDTVLVTLALKKIGVKNIIVKISNDDHGLILQKLGVTEIIVPEKDFAKQMSKRLSNDNLLDYLTLSPEYGIYEIALPDKFIGKKLNELNIRKSFNVNVIAIKDIMQNNIIINPEPDFKFNPDMVLYLLGKNDDIHFMRSL